MEKASYGACTELHSIKGFFLSSAFIRRALLTYCMQSLSEYISACTHTHGSRVFTLQGMGKSAIHRDESHPLVLLRSRNRHAYLVTDTQYLVYITSTNATGCICHDECRIDILQHISSVCIGGNRVTLLYHQGNIMRLSCTDVRPAASVQESEKSVKGGEQSGSSVAIKA